MRPESRILGWLLLAAALLLRPATAAAQFPAELAGTVRDAQGGGPLAAAGVELLESSRAVRSDGAGRFLLRGLEPGVVRVRVTHSGYAGRELAAELRNGVVTRLEVELQPLPVALAALRVTGEAPGGAATLGRAEIEASGARSAAELAERLPGVVVGGNGPSGARAASIRGSAPDQVLVLVDGVPLNDPVSGVADLSSIPAASIERLSVLAGARGARYGARAQAGVVLIETRSGRAPQRLELSAGSLGERSARGEGGASLGAGEWSVGGAVRRLDGGFRYPRDVNDPTPVWRENDDLDEWSAFAAAGAPLAGGELRLRGGWESLRRGLPGTGHTPSAEARQSLRRARGSLAWRGVAAQRSAALLLSATRQRVRFRDPAPPFGLPYDDRSELASATLRAEADQELAGRGKGAFGAGVEGSLQRVEAGALSASAPRTRRDAALFARARAGEAGTRGVQLQAEGRLDRDARAGRWYASHALTLSAARGPLSVELANRSSYTPPSLGDQFFREGVGVVPNPELRAERVPGEWELSAALAGSAGPAELGVNAAAWTGRVQGMIVWLPDFTFRWSPRNLDVDRQGVDVRARASLPARHLTLGAGWSRARITYAHVEDGTASQLAYRPRHNALLSAEWTPGAWRGEAGARYTGRRFPAPSPVNPLPGFWSTRLNLGRRWRLGRWQALTALDLDRLFDERQSLIAGYPEPGRRLRLDLRVERAILSHP